MGDCDPPAATVTQPTDRSSSASCHRLRVARGGGATRLSLPAAPGNSARSTRSALDRDPAQGARVPVAVRIGVGWSEACGRGQNAKERTTTSWGRVAATPRTVSSELWPVAKSMVCSTACTARPIAVPQRPFCRAAARGRGAAWGCRRRSPRRARAGRAAARRRTRRREERCAIRSWPHTAGRISLRARPGAGLRTPWGRRSPPTGPWHAPSRR